MTNTSINPVNGDDGITEKVYIIVENEKVYLEVEDQSVVPLLESTALVCTVTELPKEVEEINREVQTSSLVNATEFLDNEKDKKIDTIDDSSKSPLDDLDLFETEDLLNDFDSIINSYNPLNVLNDTPSSSPSGDDWGDLLTDLFPSLSSL